MNCESVISKLGFSCRSLGGDTLRVWSPFTYAGDGERIAFYVEKNRNGYRVTDNCEAMMQASAAGINFSDGRLNAIRKATGWDGCVSDGGEISTFVSESDIARGMAAVLNAALAVSHFRTQWGPRIRMESFAKDVEDVLETTLADSVLRKSTITGASGHQLEFPLAVMHGAELIYVQPIAVTDEDTVDWRRVYEAWGRMTDLKNAHIAGAERLVVLQEAANDSEMKNAITVLSDSAPVVLYTKLRQWAEQKRA